MRTSDVGVIGPSPARGRQDCLGGGRVRRSSDRGGAVNETDSDLDRMRTLYVEHAAALRRYVTRLTGDCNSAEDVVQETLLRAWRHPQIRVEAGTSIKGWLFTVARNIVIDQRRSARFRNESVSPDGSAPELAGPDEANVALDRLVVADALARLSPKHRAVIRRAYYQGWTAARIADDLGIAEGTVKSRLHAAVAALRLSMQEMGVTR